MYKSNAALLATVEECKNVFARTAAGSVWSWFPTRASRRSLPRGSCGSACTAPRCSYRPCPPTVPPGLQSPAYHQPAHMQLAVLTAGSQTSREEPAFADTQLFHGLYPRLSSRNRPFQQATAIRRLHWLRWVAPSGRSGTCTPKISQQAHEQPKRSLSWLTLAEQPKATF
jgi:hypothetical protein